MSQAGNYIPTSGPGAPVQTLTGNVGGPVPPTGGNINVVGTGDVLVTGNPGTSTLTISLTGPVGGIQTIDGDTGSITGTTVTIKSNVGSNNCGSSVLFTGSGSVMIMDVTDLNANTLVGQGSGAAGIVGTDNTALGALTLSSLTDGVNNVAVGNSALSACVDGQDNIAMGISSCVALLDGDSNIGIGSSALSSVINGNNNVGIGFDALNNITSGDDNIALGFTAGSGYTGADSSNIAIGNVGNTPESNVIRIGTTGSSAGEQNNCYIGGIQTVNVGSVASVVSINGDHLGETTLTAGTNISITPGANTITIAATGPDAFTWTVVTAGTQAMAAFNGYIANNGGTLVFTLPAVAVVGDIYRVTGINNNTGWQIAQNAGQTMYLGKNQTTTGVGGSLSSTQTRDSVEIVCVVANTGFNVISSIGNISIV